MYLSYFLTTKNIGIIKIGFLLSPLNHGHLNYPTGLGAEDHFVSQSEQLHAHFAGRSSRARSAHGLRSPPHQETPQHSFPWRQGNGHLFFFQHCDQS